mmetsp:Transcript_8444/g.17390  ORF Transcript_8444/g.17390 Transcript_8444/m.17390 type:complete len:209 (-) Transcript_8444:516-1142(-)
MPRHPTIQSYWCSGFRCLPSLTVGEKERRRASLFSATMASYMYQSDPHAIPSLVYDAMQSTISCSHVRGYTGHHVQSVQKSSLQQFWRSSSASDSRHCACFPGTTGVCPVFARPLPPCQIPAMRSAKHTPTYAANMEFCENPSTYTFAGSRLPCPAMNVSRSAMYAWSRESDGAHGAGFPAFVTPSFGNSRPKPPAPSLVVEPTPIAA